MGLINWIANLFKRCRKNSEQNGTEELINFLNKVDSAYMNAYATKSTKELRDSLGEMCLAKVASWIFTYNARYFGTPKFRTTVWTQVGWEDGNRLMQKDVTFGRVRVAGNIHMNLADDYSELWVVRTTPESYRIMDIRAVGGM